jgi:hypothetical protein
LPGWTVGDRRRLVLGTDIVVTGSDGANQRAVQGASSILTTRTLLVEGGGQLNVDRVMFLPGGEIGGSGQFDFDLTNVGDQPLPAACGAGNLLALGLISCALMFSRGCGGRTAGGGGAVTTSSYKGLMVRRRNSGRLGCSIESCFRWGAERRSGLRDITHRMRQKSQPRSERRGVRTRHLSRGRPLGHRHHGQAPNCRDSGIRAAS